MSIRKVRLIKFNLKCFTLFFKAIRNESLPSTMTTPNIKLFRINLILLDALDFFEPLQRTQMCEWIGKNKKIVAVVGTFFSITSCSFIESHSAYEYLGSFYIQCSLINFRWNVQRLIKIYGFLKFLRLLWHFEMFIIKSTMTIPRLFISAFDDDDNHFIWNDFCYVISGNF